MDFLASGQRHVFVLRHGQRIDMVDKEWKRRSDVDCVFDPPLTKIGIERSREIALSFVNKHIQYVFTSPYLRCLQTAHEVVRIINSEENRKENEKLRLRVEEGVGEWLNPKWFEEKPKTVLDRKLTKSDVFNGVRLDFLRDIDTSYSSLLSPSFPERKMEDHYRRVRMAFELLTESVEGNILVIGHGATLEASSHALVDCRPPGYLYHGSYNAWIHMQYSLENNTRGMFQNDNGVKWRIVETKGFPRWCSEAMCSRAKYKMFSLGVLIGVAVGVASYWIGSVIHKHRKLLRNDGNDKL